MSAWSDVGTDARIDPVELIDLGTRLVLLAELSARSSGPVDLPLSRTWATVYTVEEGRVMCAMMCAKEYTDNAEALEAVGLRGWAKLLESVGAERLRLQRAI
jgi:hypothetical protein